MQSSTDHDPAAQDSEPSEPPSKSARKRQMLELQELGERLARLPRERLDRLQLPDSLRQALLQAPRLRSFEARRRHAQYIGKLMRQVDPGPLRQALDDASGESRAAVALLHQIEDLRQRLLADDQALTDWLRERPWAQAQAQALRQCIRAARAEQAAGKPPRHARALYQQLKQWLQESHDEPRSPDAA